MKKLPLFVVFCVLTSALMPACQQAARRSQPWLPKNHKRAGNGSTPKAYQKQAY